MAVSVMLMEGEQVFGDALPRFIRYPSRAGATSVRYSTPTGSSAIRDTPAVVLRNLTPQAHWDSSACQASFAPHSHIQPDILAGDPMTQA